MLFQRVGSWYAAIRQGLQGMIADEKGASTAEYALILTLIVVILITSLSELGGTLNAKLRDIITQLEGAR